MLCASSELATYLFFHCSMAIFIWNALFNIFGECWACPKALDQFLLTRFVGFFEAKRSQICGSVLPMSLFGVFGWNVGRHSDK